MRIECSSCKVRNLYKKRQQIYLNFGSKSYSALQNHWAFPDRIFWIWKSVLKFSLILHYPPLVKCLYSTNIITINTRVTFISRVIRLSIIKIPRHDIIVVGSTLRTRQIITIIIQIKLIPPSF